MSLNQIKAMKSERGFTIVELLIVVVIIGILAAIVVVAYNGITNRAKTSKGSAAAASVMKKAEAFNSLTGAYPSGAVTATTGFNTAATGADVSVSLQGSGIVFAAITNGTAPSNENTVEYIPCATTLGIGAQVSYYDYGTGTKVTKTIGGTCTTNGTTFSGGPY